MALRVENDSSNLTVSDLFPIQQSPPYYDQKLYAFRNQNLHETALEVRSTHPPNSSTADVPHAASDCWDGQNYGMLQHHVEMLVVILKDDVAWKHLQRSTMSCSSMQIRHRLDDILKASFHVAVERREKSRNRFLRSDDVVITSYGNEEGMKVGRAVPLSADDDCSDGAGTLETECSSSSSYDDDEENCDGTVWHHDPEEEDIEEEDGEFLMGGRTGQGMLLGPISYKDVDLMRHPRSQILGDAQGACGTGSNPELPAVFLTPRRRSSLSRLCPLQAPMGMAPNRSPLVQRV